MNSNNSRGLRSALILLVIISGIAIYQRSQLNQSNNTISNMIEDKDQMLEFIDTNISNFRTPDSSFFYYADYSKPAYAKRWKYFDEVTSEAIGYGIVIAKARVGVINNEASGETSAIAIYILHGAAGSVNYYIGDDGYKYPGEIQFFYAYGGDNSISGNPKVGDIVSFRNKGDDYIYGYTIYLEPKNVSSSHDFAKQLISEPEYTASIAELTKTINWLKTDQKLLDEVSIEILQGEFNGPTLVRRMEKHGN